jgi:hypothetical protein
VFFNSFFLFYPPQDPQLPELQEEQEPPEPSCLGTPEASSDIETQADIILSAWFWQTGHFALSPDRLKGLISSNLFLHFLQTYS